MALFVGVLLFTGLFFYLGFRFFIWPVLQRKQPGGNMPLVFSWAVACLTLTGILCSGFIYYALISFFNLPGGQFFLSGAMLKFLGLGGAGLLVMPLFKEKSLLVQSIVIYVFCLLGCFLILPLNSVYSFLYCALLALGWLGVMLLSVFVDRAPLVSYLTNSALLLVLSFGSSGFFPLLETPFFYFFLTVLFFHLMIFLFMKKVRILNEFFPIVFLINWLAGYPLISMADPGSVIYIPVFYGYQLVEFLLVFVPVVFFKRNACMAIEQAFQRGVPVKLIVRKMFYYLILIDVIGLIGLKTSRMELKYCAVVYLMVGIVLYNLYLSFVLGGEKITLRSSIKDFGKGLKTLFIEGRNFVLQSLLDAGGIYEKKKKAEYRRPEEKEPPEARAKKNRAPDEKKQRGKAGKR